MGSIIKRLSAKGFMTYSHENMVFVCPPLIITKEQLKEEMIKSVYTGADARCQAMDEIKKLGTKAFIVTGSETTQFTIITDTEKDIKMLLKGPVLLPDVAVIDPMLTITAPPSITAATGLDALTHAIEAYTSKKSQLLTDGLALSAIKRIFTYLPIAYKDGSNVKAREEMSIAAFEAGSAFNNASVTIVHGMSRPIGALFHVPHGISNAMLMKECFAFALDGAYEKFGTLGRSIRVAREEESNTVAAEAFLNAVVALCATCEIPTLEKYGIDKEKFFDVIDKMADDAIASGSPGNTLKHVSKEDVVEIYKRLW